MKRKYIIGLSGKYLKKMKNILGINLGNYSL